MNYILFQIRIYFLKYIYPRIKGNNLKSAERIFTIFKSTSSLKKKEVLKISYNQFSYCKIYYINFKTFFIVIS